MRQTHLADEQVPEYDSEDEEDGTDDDESEESDEAVEISRPAAKRKAHDRADPNF